MSNVVRAAVPVVKVASRLVRKHWKSIAGAFTLVTAFVKEHPEIPAYVRLRLDDIQRRVKAQLDKRDPAARITGVLQIVRDEARATGGGFDPAPWTGRADAIERDLRLAKVQPAADRRQTLERLQSETADLLSNLLLALAESRASDTP